MLGNQQTFKNKGGFLYGIIYASKIIIGYNKEQIKYGVFKKKKRK